MPLLTGGNIANVERIKVVTQETTSRTFVFQTATSCKFTAALSSGAEVEQRVKNQILGLIKTDDLVKGYDIEFTDERLIGQVMALIDGGALTMDTQNAAEWTSYASPVSGAGVTRTPFTLTLYTSDRDTDGSANEYYSWEFAGCKGKPVDWQADDGKFTQITYKLESRPATGASALNLTRVAALPSVT